MSATLSVIGRRRADSLEFTEKDWDDVMAVNIKAVFFLSQAAARSSSGRDGRADHQHRLDAVVPGRHPRAVLHGVQERRGGLTRLLANEWAKDGINVNAIAPGYMATDNTAPLRADPAAARRSSPASRRAAGDCRRTSRGRWCSWRRRPRTTSTGTRSRSTAAGWHADPVAGWNAEHVPARTTSFWPDRVPGGRVGRQTGVPAASRFWAGWTALP